jgi:hypothetical protein
MTWVEIDCGKCGCSESIGIYHSDYQHELTEWKIILTCGYCQEEEE